MDTALAPTPAPLSFPSRLRELVASHPVATYLVASFLIGWAILIPVLATGLPAEAGLAAVVLLAQLAPAVLVTAADRGRPGVRDLFARVFRWRVHPAWYATAVLALPVSTLAVATLARGTGPVQSVLRHPALVGAYLAALLITPVINLWEETGWMGLVQGRLAERHGPLAAAALTAPLFGLIHLPLVVAQQSSLAAALAVDGLIMAFAVPFRIILGWLYRRTGSSLLLVALFHAAYNATNATGLLAGSLPGVEPSLITAAVTTAWAGILVWRTRGRLS